MTTSSSQRLVAHESRRRAPKQPPRYDRCRGGSGCRGSQVSAEIIERRVVEWMKTPRSRLSYDAAIVLGAYARVWRKASVASRGRLLAQLVWEIRWHGPRRRFYVTLDEVGIAQERARLEALAETDAAAGP